MQTRARFVLNVLAPPPIATILILSVIFMIEGDGPLIPALSILPWAICWGYMIAGLPSILHAWWLNSRYKSGLYPRSGHAVVRSMQSGTVAGVSLAIVSAILEQDIDAGVLIMIPLGAAVGALNGLLQFLIRE